MPIKLLQHKSWHVYSAENIARVKRDEALAEAKEVEDDQRSLLADSEARLDRMRRTVEGKKRKRDRDDEGEKALDRQLKGKGRQEEGARDEDVRATIVRPAAATAQVGKGEGEVKDRPMTTNGHVNFWAELEDGGQPGFSKLESRLKKVIAAEPDDSLTKVYLAKKGEGEPVGWYASRDGKTERERKESIETTLERTYRDTESKRFSDPLALMNSYLQRRDDVLSGKVRPTPRSRSSTTAPWDDTPRSTLSSASSSSTRLSAGAAAFEPVLPTLLPRKHERRAAPVPSSSASYSRPRRSPSPAARPATAPPRDPAAEAASRVASERQRAAALLAARRKAALSSASTTASSTPARSEAGDTGGAGSAAGWGVYNREAVERATAARSGGAGSWEDRRGGRGGGGGWAERRERREERERGGGGGGQRWGPERR
ncbi:hypothetical protein JCM9279_007719 [Rhodotorula babjevae]